MALRFLLLLVFRVACEETKVAVQDLLSPALSPAALLGSPLGSTEVPVLEPGQDANQSMTGDLSHALGTMLYHRSMMNEYLCHNYLADEILSDLRPLESRSGEAVEVNDPGSGVDRDQLLADPGSTSYKDWLEKSSGLKKMYSRADSKSSDQEGYETGDVTGYATVQGSKEGYNYGGGSSWTSGGGGGGGWSSGGGGGGGWSSGGGGGTGSGWAGGGGGWADNAGHGWHSNSGSDFSRRYIVKWHGVADWEWEEHESGKGLALKDLFDLALTALAILAFGVFILQLIMSCFAKTPHLTVMMTVTTTPSTVETRSKRETNELNELSFRVLTSIDRLMELQEENDRTQDGCLAYTLCDNNKYSRALNNNNRLWLPVWSLGMSWAAGFWNSSLSRIDNIRASVLGLGNADCAALYPQCSQLTRQFEK